MITIWPCAVLAGVLCIANGGTPAQDKLISVLLLDKDGTAVLKHRLTVENVRRMFAVERDLLRLMQEIPDFWRRATQVESPRQDDVTGLAKVFEQTPETAHILERQRISAREYLLTRMAAETAERMEEVLAHEGVRRPENDEMEKELLMIPALQFWRKMDPALKAEAAEWKKVREEMARH